MTEGDKGGTGALEPAAGSCDLRGHEAAKEPEQPQTEQIGDEKASHWREDQREDDGNDASGFEDAERSRSSDCRADHAADERVR